MWSFNIGINIDQLLLTLVDLVELECIFEFIVINEQLQVGVVRNLAVFYDQVDKAESLEALYNLSENGRGESLKLRSLAVGPILVVKDLFRLLTILVLFIRFFDRLLVVGNS